MLLDIIFMRDDHVILRDVDGSEVSLTAEDAEFIQTFLYVSRREIHEMALQQKQEERSNWGIVMRTRLEREEKRILEERRRADGLT